MYYIAVHGRVIGNPEVKLSAKGNPYAKVTVESLPEGRNKYGNRVYCVAFGDLVAQVQKAHADSIVELQGTPEAKGYLNRNGEPAAALNVVLARFSVEPKAPLPDVNLTDDDIPF